MKVDFKRVYENEYPSFREDVNRTLSIAVIDEFEEYSEEGEVISDEEVNESLYKENAEAYYVYVDEKKIGGIIVDINNTTQHNSLDIFFVYPEFHSKGYGYNIWKAIEEKYPKTKVWELVTPYFEKRNINFYVNKCGFKIVEFFNEYHNDPHFAYSEGGFKEEFFRFEKIMK